MEDFLSTQNHYEEEKQLPGLDAEMKWKAMDARGSLKDHFAKQNLFEAVRIKLLRLRHENQRQLSQIPFIESLPRNTVALWSVVTKTCFTKNKVAKLGTVLQKRTCFRLCG